MPRRAAADPLPGGGGGGGNGRIARPWFVWRRSGRGGRAGTWDGPGGGDRTRCRQCILDRSKAGERP